MDDTNATRDFTSVDYDWPALPVLEEDDSLGTFLESSCLEEDVWTHPSIDGHVGLESALAEPYHDVSTSASFGPVAVEDQPAIEVADHDVLSDPNLAFNLQAVDSTFDFGNFDQTAYSSPMFRPFYSSPMPAPHKWPASVSDNGLFEYCSGSSVSFRAPHPPISLYHTNTTATDPPQAGSPRIIQSLSAKRKLNTSALLKRQRLSEGILEGDVLLGCFA